MKYVQVNGGFILVKDYADAEQIIREAVRTKGYSDTTKWVLAKFNANGTTMQVRGNEVSGYADFSMYGELDHV